MSLITDRWYQSEAIQATWNSLSINKGNPLIALPTGTGKGVVIARMIQQAMMYGGTRIACLTHVKELIKQNYDKYSDIGGNLDHAGIVSAGLGKKQFGHNVVFGGVGSVWRNVNKLGYRDLLLIDEAHLLNHKADTLYKRTIDGLLNYNPNLRIIGLTATPFRTGQGLLTDGGFFTDICYDLTKKDDFERLINEGYLARLITKQTKSKIDVSNVSILAGDYNLKELEKAANEDRLNYDIVTEICEWGKDRICWLVFASGVEHAQNLTKLFNWYGISAACLHGDLPTNERDSIIEQYKAGKIRCLVNFNVATTGFDHPPIDLIAIVRATTSTGLWIQMLGRGTRPSLETMKQNCLVLDFGRNIERLGPINDPVIPKKRGDGKPGLPPIRICPQCLLYNHASSRVCDECGYEFPPASDKFTPGASNLDVIVTSAPIVEWFNVTTTIYSRAKSNADNTPMMKVTYVCGNKSFKEYVCLEHNGYAKVKAQNWWKFRAGTTEAPPNTEEALKWTDALRMPIKVQVHTNKKYPEVLSYEFA